MAKRQVFYSFHYENDARRVAQIKNIGVLEGNEPVSPNEWEEVKSNGDGAIKKWIDSNMEYKTCLIVWIGEKTANRKWINYEIKRAWDRGMGVLGVYIHNIKDPLLCRNGGSGVSKKGKNPFEYVTVDSDKLSDIVDCYNPDASDAYSCIEDNISDWIEEAIEIRNQYK